MVAMATKVSKFLRNISGNTKDTNMVTMATKVSKFLRNIRRIEETLGCHIYHKWVTEICQKPLNLKLIYQISLLIPGNMLQRTNLPKSKIIYQAQISIHN